MKRSTRKLSISRETISTLQAATGGSTIPVDPGTDSCAEGCRTFTCGPTDESCKLCGGYEMAQPLLAEW